MLLALEVVLFMLEAVGSMPMPRVNEKRVTCAMGAVSTEVYMHGRHKDVQRCAVGARSLCFMCFAQENSSKAKVCA